MLSVLCSRYENGERGSTVQGGEAWRDAVIHSESFSSGLLVFNLFLFFFSNSLKDGFCVLIKRLKTVGQTQTNSIGIKEKDSLHIYL